METTDGYDPSAVDQSWLYATERPRRCWWRLTGRRTSPNDVPSLLPADALPAAARPSGPSRLAVQELPESRWLLVEIAGGFGMILPPGPFLELEAAGRVRRRDAGEDRQRRRHPRGGGIGLVAQHEARGSNEGLGLGQS
jgi:hypothetical protein